MKIAALGTNSRLVYFIYKLIRASEKRTAVYIRIKHTKFGAHISAEAFRFNFGISESVVCKFGRILRFNAALR